MGCSCLQRVKVYEPVEAELLVEGGRLEVVEDGAHACAVEQEGLDARVVAEVGAMLAGRARREAGAELELELGGDLFGEGVKCKAL